MRVLQLNHNRITLGCMKNAIYVTITFFRPLFRAENDGNCHFAPEVLEFGLQYML